MVIEKEDQRNPCFGVIVYKNNHLRQIVSVVEINVEHIS